MPESSKFEHLLLAGIIVAYAAVFIIDLQTPRGFAWGMPYAIIVMVTYWIKSRRITVGAGFLGTVLTVAGFFLFETSPYPVVGGTNRLLALIVIWASVWFVNRYKTSLDKIKKNKKRISALFEAATEGIIISDIKGNIVMVNEKTEELFGYSREELIGLTIEQLIPSRYRSGYKRYRQDYYEDPEPRPMGQGRDLYGLKKNGEEFPVEVNLNHFETEEGKFYISNFTDITERRRLEEEVLNISERERQRIGRDLHDDIGQLLTLAKLNADSLKEKVKSGKKIEPNEVEEVIDVINTTTERARSLSHSLVPSDIKSKGLSYALQELVRELSTLHDVKLNYKGWTEDIPLRDSNSSAHLYRIVQEAINNAIKHGNATIIDVELNVQKDHITLRIEDNGKGFSELEEMNDGIGVRGMHFRAHMIGGNLEINSEKGKGTEVFCQIPLTAITHET